MHIDAHEECAQDIVAFIDSVEINKEHGAAYMS